MTTGPARHLNPRILGWFADRGLDEEVVTATGIYSGRRKQVGDEDWAVEPDPSGNLIVYPYLEHGREVNYKARAGGKRFFQKKEGRKTFWNSDVIDDPELRRKNGTAALVITEGECDCISAIQAGHPWTVSVPDGAPAHRDSNGNVIPLRPLDDIDPQHDAKFSYITNNWDRLKSVRRIILAVDGDEAGIRLRVELARRLGEMRCRFVEYPKEPVIEQEDGTKRPVKDFNEVLQHYGADYVRAMIRDAKPYPVAGLFKLSDFADDGPMRFFSTGFDAFDQSPEGRWQLYEGAFIVMSGLPESGKSALADQIGYNVAACHGWPVCIASFEEPIKPQLRDKLRGFHIAKPEGDWTRADIAEADAFIERYFTFVTAAKHSSVPGFELDEPEQNLNIDWVLDRFADAVIRDGIKLAILDPWNEMDHNMKGSTLDEYLNDAVRKCKRFCATYGVTLIIVVHPTKTAVSANKHGEAMSMYDVNGGATWANKAEIGVLVQRKEGFAEIRVAKMKFHKAGKRGVTTLVFDEAKRMFKDVGA